jgi:RNA polymerase sigma-70 factor (ECF subfamily)
MIGESSDDVNLMMRVKGGDREAFGLLVQRYQKPLMNFIFRFTSDAAVSEDLAQEVFLKVFRSAARYEPKAGFSTWLYRIAGNAALNFIRDRKTRYPLSIDGNREDESSEPQIDLPDRRPLVEEQMVEQERVQVIRQAVASLPDNQRLALVLTKYQGMSLKEAAVVLKCSEQAVKSLIFRAYVMLREKLVCAVSV